MPAVRKKGAIFAIYNDSPVASTSQAPVAPTSPTKRPGAAIKRKALTAVQPIVPAKRTVPGSEKKEKAVAETAKPAAAASRKVTEKENLNPVQSPKKITPRGVKKGTLVAKSIAGSRAKRYEVEWDPNPVLGDVSAVYGADPTNEPAGFRNVDAPKPIRRSKRRSTISSTHASSMAAATASTPRKNDVEQSSTVA